MIPLKNQRHYKTITCGLLMIKIITCDCKILLMIKIITCDCKILLMTKIITCDF